MTIKFGSRISGLFRKPLTMLLHVGSGLNQITTHKRQQKEINELLKSSRGMWTKYYKLAERAFSRNDSYTVKEAEKVFNRISQAIYTIESCTSIEQANDEFHKLQKLINNSPIG